MYDQHCALLKSLYKKVSLWKHNNNNYGNLLSRIICNKKVNGFGDVNC